MLEIKDLHASINGKEILKGINLTIRDGEVHALMGQNGAGKSTLSNVLVGHPAYEVTRGTVTFNGKDLLAMSPEDRAHEGIFLSFQTPVEIPGVSMVNLCVPLSTNSVNTVICPPVCQRILETDARETRHCRTGQQTCQP